MVTTLSDPIFELIETRRGVASGGVKSSADEPKGSWGRVLDAGTGRHSLSWIAGLRSQDWTAVTIDTKSAANLERLIGAQRRESDRILVGDWSDPGFLAGEQFDTVIADYLLAAVDGHRPYFEDQTLERLRPHVRDRLFIVGWEPVPKRPTERDRRIFWEIERLRDATILLAGDRPYRELPRDWVVRQLERAAFQVIESWSIPVAFGPKEAKRWLDVARRKLARLAEPQLVRGIEAEIERLDRASARFEPTAKKVRYSYDYVIEATPC